MLSASSPVTYPQSSSPPAPKRPAHDHSRQPKPRLTGPFIIDDDESEDDPEVEGTAHIAKKRKLSLPGEEHTKSRFVNVAAAASQSQRDSQSKDELERPHQRSMHLSGSQVLPFSWFGSCPISSDSIADHGCPPSYLSRACNGKSVTIRERREKTNVSYESMVAARSKTKEGRAKRSYYGIDIHDLMNQASQELANPQQPASAGLQSPAGKVQEPSTVVSKKSRKSLLWTEKYRARTFMDLCGDDGTNRMVLRWLKRWDSLVFPGVSRAKASRRLGPTQKADEDKPHRKILLLTGPPGLGKTTLAHVCARQAGYEVLEVNASDDRTRDVVKNRIRTGLGTQSVKTVTNTTDGKTPQRPARPMCVVVDEVDGVTSGSGASGEGGFIRALIDLVLVDQKNAWAATSSAESSRRKKKGDDFRQMRPLILICNDVYHPSLRALRQSNLAEVIHVGRPSMDAAVGRLKTVLEKEGIPCEKDAARKLCEAAWGVASGIDAKRGAESTVQGDLRGVMVVGEWVAGRFRSSCLPANRTLTRQWIEANVLHELASGAAGARGLGRGSVKDIVKRLFQEGGGFPRQAAEPSDAKATAKAMHEQPRAELGFGEQQKKLSMERLGQMINTSGEVGTVVTAMFAEYPTREFNDDCYLTKPNQAYDWLHFHDQCQSRLYASQEWELAPYLGQPVLAWHHLFASPKRQHGGFGRWGGGEAEDQDAPPAPFSGARADHEAREAERQTRAQLQALQAQLSPSLMRAFRSAEDVAADLLPYLVRMVSPDVRPVVGGSQGSMASVRPEGERALVRRAAAVLAEVGVALHKGRIEGDAVPGRGSQFVYRMDPYVLFCLPASPGRRVVAMLTFFRPRPVQGPRRPLGLRDGRLAPRGRLRAGALRRAPGARSGAPAGRGAARGEGAPGAAPGGHPGAASRGPAAAAAEDDDEQRRAGGRRRGARQEGLFRARRRGAAHGRGRGRRRRRAEAAAAQGLGHVPRGAQQRGAEAHLARRLFARAVEEKGGGVNRFSGEARLAALPAAAPARASTEGPRATVARQTHGSEWWKKESPCGSRCRWYSRVPCLYNRSHRPRVSSAPLREHQREKRKSKFFFFTKIGW